MYSKCYLFLKVSTSSSCPLQLHKPVHLWHDTVPKNLSCHVFMSLPSVHSCRLFCSFVGYDSLFHEIVKVCCRAHNPLPNTSNRKLTGHWASEMYNKDRQYAIMLGGLYIEMPTLKLLGLVN